MSIAEAIRIIDAARLKDRHRLNGRDDFVLRRLDSQGGGLVLQHKRIPQEIIFGLSLSLRMSQKLGEVQAETEAPPPLQTCGMTFCACVMVTGAP